MLFMLQLYVAFSFMVWPGTKSSWLELGNTLVYGFHKHVWSCPDSTVLTKIFIGYCHVGVAPKSP